MLVQFNALVLDEAAHFENVKSTQQGLPYNVASLMNPISNSGYKKKGWKRQETAPWYSTARGEPCQRDYLDYLHINLVYCGGRYRKSGYFHCQNILVVVKTTEINFAKM